MRRRRLLLALAGLPWLAACGEAGPAFHNTDLTGKVLGEVVTLNDAYGQPRTLADFHGRIVLLFFGYTTCPDICPGALAKYAALLQQPGLDAAQVQVIFVTLDPERDTPERLRDYLAWFHPSFIGLTGTPERIATLARQLHVTHVRREIGGGVGYVIDHSAGAYAFGPDGRLRLHLAENAPLEHIVSDLRLLLR